MKIKSIIILFVFAIICSCTDVKDKLTAEYGIVTSVETYQRYIPSIHIYTDVYKVGVQFKDTLIYIMEDHQPQLGDSILIYTNRDNKTYYERINE